MTFHPSGFTPPLRVVIAEDNSVLASVIRYNLELAGFEAHVARNGNEAWQTVDSVLPNLLISDYQMPFLNGEQLCRKLRDDGRFKDLPIIFLTAKGMERGFSESLTDLNIKAVLFKPFSPRELIALAQSVTAAPESTSAPITSGI